MKETKQETRGIPAVMCVFISSFFIYAENSCFAITIYRVKEGNIWQLGGFLSPVSQELLFKRAMYIIQVSRFLFRSLQILTI